MRCRAHEQSPRLTLLVVQMEAARSCWNDSQPEDRCRVTGIEQEKAVRRPRDTRDGSHCKASLPPAPPDDGSVHETEDHSQKSTARQEEERTHGEEHDEPDDWTVVEQEGEGDEEEHPGHCRLGKPEERPCED